MMDITEADVLDVLSQIETGEVTLQAMLDPQIQIKSDILYEASNGWKIEVSNWSGEFSGIVEIILPDGRILDLDYLDEHMPKVCLYFPDKDVEWLAYQMKKTIIGYIYRAHDKLGRFESCQAGDVITNPNREPPWIVVNHSLQSTNVAHWPGRLFRAEVIDAADPQNHRGQYTRCVSVKILEEVKTETLFGVNGAKIEEVLRYGTGLTLETAQILANNRHEKAKSIQSLGWHRWLEYSESREQNIERDMSGVVMAGQGASRSPIGHGLSLAHQCVWDTAKQLVGDEAFEEDEDGIWLKPPWSEAASTMLDTAWAFGVPKLFNQPDLFSETEIKTLLQAWENRDTHGH